MTMIEKFMAFARALPSDRRESMEESLAALMESFSEEHDLTPEQMAELDRRVAEQRPEFSAEEDIGKLFGKPFDT